MLAYNVKTQQVTTFDTTYMNQQCEFNTRWGSAYAYRNATDSLLVHGGVLYGQEEPCEFYEFEFSTGKWHEHAIASHIKRCYHSGIMLDDNRFVIVGNNDLLPNDPSVIVFNLATKTCTCFLISNVELTRNTFARSLMLSNDGNVLLCHQSGIVTLPLAMQFNTFAQHMLQQVKLMQWCDIRIQ